VNAANIKTGNPKIEGRYVALVQITAHQASEWVEPVILTWASGRWHTWHRGIVGWIGPIPVMKVADIVVPPAEFDL